MNFRDIPGCCERLDDFLDGDLQKYELQVFLNQIANCAECQQVISDHEKVDEQIRTAWKNVSVPAMPSERFVLDSQVETNHSSIRQQNQLTLRLSIVLAASVIIGLAVGLAMLMDRDLGSSHGELAKKENDKVADSEKLMTEDQPVFASVNFDQNQIGVPLIQTKSFTVIEVFDTVRPVSTDSFE